jgi:hypothetical protein
MIVHNLKLVIFLISITLIVIFKLNNILMQKLNLSLYFRNIFVIMTNILIIKINNNKQIISTFNILTNQIEKTILLRGLHITSRRI